MLTSVEVAKGAYRCHAYLFSWGQCRHCKVALSLLRLLMILNILSCFHKIVNDRFFKRPIWMSRHHYVYSPRVSCPHLWQVFIQTGAILSICFPSGRSRYTLYRMSTPRKSKGYSFNQKYVFILVDSHSVYFTDIYDRDQFIRTACTEMQGKRRNDFSGRQLI
jgi:hypothetical protein